MNFQKSVNDDVRSYKGKTIKIKNDLDLKDIAWKPIGMIKKENSETGIYQGNIDGENHTIANMSITMSDASDYRGVGFIGKLSATGTVKNLKFDKPNIVTNKSWVGVAVGYSVAGYIDNVHILNGHVEGYDDVVGVYGVSDMAEISNCSNSSYVSGNTCIGEICGYISNYWSTVDNSNGVDSIKYCNFEGKVEGNEQVGGLAGIESKQTNIRCSYNLGSVVDNSKVGGILGISDSQKTIARIYNTYNLGSITASKESGVLVVVQMSKLLLV